MNTSRMEKIAAKTRKGVRGSAAVLWAQGHNAAAVRLEHLWHNPCKGEDFSLFCAYPKIGFTDYALKSMEDICTAHSQVIV